MFCIAQSCKLHRGIYSWAGAVSEGSYFGDDHVLFVSMLVSGAEGQYNLNFLSSAAVNAAAHLSGGQAAKVLAPHTLSRRPIWTYTGQGSAFIVESGAELEIEGVTVAASSG
eukprot:SAG31_NODE_20841_length_564_cov_1.101075_1_plen_111_part_01